MDLNTILSASNNDLLRGNQYTISVTNPATGSLGRTSSINCNQVDFPGSSYGTFDRRQKGPIIRIPNDKIFPEVNLSFYVDNQAQVRTYFQEWHEFIYTENNQFRFFDEYKGQVTIQDHSRQGRPVQTAELIDCYPIIISPTSLSYDNSNQPEVLSLTLQCREIKINKKFIFQL